MLHTPRSRLALAALLALLAVALASALFREASLSHLATLLERHAGVAVLGLALLCAAALAASAAILRSAHHGTAELERLRAELDLERGRLEAVLHLLPAGVLFADRQGRILRANDEARRIWSGRARSRPPTTYKACRARSADTGAALSSGEWGVFRALRTGAASPRQHLEIDRFDGTRGEVLASDAPIRDRHGAVIGAVAILEDVSALRTAVAQATAQPGTEPADLPRTPPPPAHPVPAAHQGSGAGSTGTREATVAARPGRWPSRLP
ncbi:MAG TPA: hypothetical protein VMU15_21595 [Anaeromyxobacter sp.]|nr:hypothetical protein [Anaeromyxobacter sp.]